jgi:restriction system protein
MSQRTFAFDPPRWQFSQLHNQTGRLLLVSAVWVLGYGWLGYRVWNWGFSAGWVLNLALAVGCIGLGVGVALSWRVVGLRWVSRLRSTVLGARWQSLKLEELQTMTPSEFEECVAQRIFERQGYHVVNVRDTKDGGVDILVTDEHGRQAIVQCKRYRANVGEPILRDLYGTMIHAGAVHAYLITTAGFSSSACRWAEGKPMTLVDGPRLVTLVNGQEEL